MESTGKGGKERGGQGIVGGKWYAHPPLRNALISGVLTGATFGAVTTGIVPPLASILFYVIAIVLGGYYWGRDGIEELFEERKIGIQVLMLAATVGAALAGLWDEAAFLAFLYGAAEGVEEYTYARTRTSIRALLDLAPKEARVLREGKEEVIPAEDLNVGDTFIVRPGESIPTDGIIHKGSSSIDEAPVTGESLPVEKHEGMKVFAGTMNKEGALEVQTTATFEDNTLSKIIHLVEEAQERKGESQLFIEKFGMRYSPIVLLTAVLLVVIPAPLFGVPFSYWALRAIVFLVAASPCALVMSTPVAIAAGIGRAGRTGVLMKGGVYLETLGTVKAIAFDKTGTLTKGTPVVTDVIALNGERSDVLTLAYNVERYSEHPLAKAIVLKAEDEGMKRVEVSDFSALAGYGARATMGDKTLYVGKQELFERLGQDGHSLPHIEQLRGEGKTVILVGSEEHVDGIIALRDEARPQARETMECLHHMGITVIMLTGDNDVSARAIARELGIDEVRADLTPEGKVEAITQLEQAYGGVAMVGDGINDAPALAQATVGIAMGTAGTDAAIEAADVALMADDLSKVPFALRLSKKARRISGQNIAFSLLVLGVLIPSALGGLLTVAAAVFFHEASELLAVANGLRAAWR
ncbi:MAG: heavy metal translocating P-type ATPase [Halobacteriota archaeon]